MRSKKAIEEAIRTNLNHCLGTPLRDQLLARALREQEQSQTTGPALSEPTTRRMIMKIPAARIAVAALIGTGIVAAAAVGVKYHFMGTDAERGYLVASEDGRNMMNIAEEHAASPEQAVETAEEIALLKQQGQRRLVLMSEFEVNGQLDRRTLTYEYDLSDGRTIRMGERDPDDDAPGTLTGERLKEARQLWHEILKGSRLESTPDGGHRFVTAEGEEIPRYEQTVQGQTFVVDKYTFTLSDGTEVAWSLGRLKEDK